MKTLDNFEIKNKKIIFRADLNVPVLNGKITDYSRIESIIPSIKLLSENKNKIFIVAHFGRPRGEINKKYSIRFLCSELKKILNQSVIHFIDNFDQKKLTKKQQNTLKSVNL